MELPFNRIVNWLKAGGTGTQIMPGAMGKLLADMGLTEIGPHRYDHHNVLAAYRQKPKVIVFDTPYGPAGMPVKQAKDRLDAKDRAKRRRFVGPFPTHGKKARLASDG